MRNLTNLNLQILTFFCKIFTLDREGPVNPLPQHMAEFISDADDGLVLFSLGYTGFTPEDVPAHLMNSFINSFSKLSQKVIVRYKKELLSKIPENVLVVDWLPQHDLLGEQLYNCETLNLFWSSAIML